jgi:quinol monooxygenase YgiN
MITVAIKIKTHHGKREEVRNILSSIIEPSLVQQGCKAFSVYNEMQDTNAFFLLEEWRTREDFDSYVGSEEFKKILAILDLATIPPEIKISTVSDTVGLEAIEAILRDPDSQTVSAKSCVP